MRTFLSIAMAATVGLAADPVQPRWIAEREIAIAAARTLIALGELRDADGLVVALRTAYARMEAGAPVPAPTFETLPDDGANGTLEMIWVATEAMDPPKQAIVFLHGYAGNFAVQCWHVARAASRLGAFTVCPSLGFRGDWWTERGGQVLDRTIAHLTSLGLERIVLVGLSNGARGAAVHARRHRNELAGVILISGAAAVAPPTKIPVLVIHGDHDTMFSSSTGRRYARAAGRHGTFSRLSGGHFVFLERFDEAARAIDQWIEHTPFR